MHSNLLQIFTRVYLDDLSRQLGRRALLADIPDQSIDQWAASGFDYLWLLGIWQTGEKGREVSRNHSQWRGGFESALPDLTDEDISGSPFAIKSYQVHEHFGDHTSLIDFRARLAERGIKLILDFVPNHTAIDHNWAFEHPEFYLHGSEEDLQNEPENYLPVATKNGPAILAYGRDPYFSGWPDTLQLNYRSAAVKLAMQDELLNIAQFCDGVRCDMAMLVLPEIFQRTWGDQALTGNEISVDDESFWPDATKRVREVHPAFLFMAEVYWEMEWELLQSGFDFAYDKRLYDRLRSGNAHEVRGHLIADPAYQSKLVRFLENHDEPRAASTFRWEQHKAAAVISFPAPGMRFHYDGQMEGRKVHASMHLGRRPEEETDPEIHEFYRILLKCLTRPELREGTWQLLDCRTAWEGNQTWSNFIAYLWTNGDDRTLVAVNYGDSQAQCYVPVELTQWQGAQVVLTDLLGSAVYHRDGNELISNGLYLDMPAWGYHVFTCAIRQ